MIKIPRYDAAIITNGYLFNKEIIRKLTDLKITGIQITLDGSSIDHNLRRICKSDENSYDKIKSNIENIISVHGKNIKLTVNTNLDYNNLEQYSELLEEFIDYKEYINFSISRTCYDLINQKEEIPFDKFIKIQSKLYSLVEKKGFINKELFIPVISQYIGCFNEIYQGLTISPDANIYKCLMKLNNNSSFGYISNNGYLKLQQNPETKFWQEYTLINRKECNLCKFLPLCMGGCPKIISTEQCKKYKNHFINRIINSYV